ncbi:MAG: putative hydro-lyase [Alphaproteobacteria bacterium]|nr:putative hydro-lyase [Alphaproteobacteria bacterium]
MMALEQIDGASDNPFPFDISTASPSRLRGIFRSGAYRGTTANMANGYTQGNLAILPANHALDFARFCQRNPKPCPLVGVSDTGDPIMRTLGEDIDIRTDIPSYNIYRDGVIDASVSDISEFWADDSVAFVLGCSFSFEEALMQARIPMRHMEIDRVVPMYKTSIQLVRAGPFGGGTVVSMRPMSMEEAIRASAITARFPHTHGMPVHIGDPAVIGIKDLDAPDWGDPTEFRDGEVPVFWACGVTPQNAIQEAGIPIVLTHTPGRMLITDLPSAVT